MHIIKVNLKKKSYNIAIGKSILSHLGRYLSRLDIGKDAYVVTNSFLKDKYGHILTSTLKKSGFTVRFKLIADTEKSKSIRVATNIIDDITHYDSKRKIFIIAFGGGVVGDLAGFTASIYKRGIAYIQVPTTLLAQVDSSIGGKTGVDMALGKNLVGAFHQPRLVYSDVSTLRSLEPRQVKSAMAEVIKYGIINDPTLFGYLENHYREILDLDMNALEYIIMRASKIKSRIVELDEREEKGVRTILNFGHTIGHAIEAAGGFKGHNHGEAVALGMLAAARISQKLGLINGLTLSRLEDLLKNVGLPTAIKKVALADIIKFHYHDKKFSGSHNRFVLLKGIGRVKIVNNIPLEIIRQALNEII